MSFVVRFKQGSGGGGCKCCLSSVSSRGVVVNRISPPSRISSEGGECCHVCCSVAATVGCCCHVGHAISHVSSEEGMVGWRRIHPPPSRVLSTEGGTGV